MYRLSVILALLATQASADIFPHKLFSSGAVIQRETPFILKGTAVNETVVSVFIDGEKIGEADVTEANDWRLNMPAHEAGGPYTITLRGQTQTQISDIYFGDVWLASGQSNMELTMARVKQDYPEDIHSADFLKIREFTVEDRYAFDQPKSDYEQGKWLTATPDNIEDLSAVAFYFARELHRSVNVPIGIVNASLGGSPVEAWMPESALKEYPDSIEQLTRFKDVDFVANTIESDQQRQSEWYAALDQKDKGLTSNVEWYEFDADDSDWQSFSLPGYLDGSETAGFSGVWWLRKHFWLPEKPDKTAWLDLGRVVDADEAYINGVKVGNTTYQYPPRHYSVPSSLLQQGDNVIAVRVTSTGNESGFVADKPYTIGNDQFKISLMGDWRYALGATQSPLAPQTFVRWQPSGLYNAMIAPAGEFPVKGAIWYQGESNTKTPDGYDSKLQSMIKSWRTLWSTSNLPVYIVQLANFMERRTLPTESNWAELRQHQSEVAQSDNVELIATLDLGEWNDIHPTNKRDVGLRLANSALATVYNKHIDYKGPEASTLIKDGRRLKVKFEETSLPLKLTLAGHNGFAIAGKDGKYKWATPVIIENEIILSHPDIAEPVSVRYAWADNPVAGLYGANGLPAAPFTLTLNET